MARTQVAWWLLLAAVLAAVLAAAPEVALAAGAAPEAPPPAPVPTRADYPMIAGLSGRAVVWAFAQMHLFLAAFVLAVPLFVLVIELTGVLARDDRYDNMAHEFMKISMAAYSFAALSGGGLTLALFLFYPVVMDYLLQVFRGQTLIYAALFVMETACLYVYYYSWGALRRGDRKWVHLSVGLVLNAVGTTLMFVANAWTTFMMSPAGVDPITGAVTGTVWEATRNPLWIPLNLHRFIANVAYGGAIVGAYAAYRFLSVTSREQRAHYDWMGYTSNLIAVSALLPLPFAGYWLTAEMYAYSQQLGITTMGGVLAWLFIIQAVLIGAILLAANYYLWCGLSRTDEGARYAPYVKYIAVVLVGGFLVWVAPRTLILTPEEVRMLGGTHHKVLGPLGLMPAKNIAVNLMLLATFLSFQLFRRARRVPTVSWAKAGNAVMVALYVVAVVNITAAGLYGYVTPTVYKVGSSMPQVATTLSVIVFALIIDGLMGRGAVRAEVRWGQMPVRSQYALFVLPVAFTWLMALMGYVRSSVRTHWHVYTVMKDVSPDSYIPTMGSAGNMVTLVTVAFMVVIVFVFWLSQLGATQQVVATREAAE
jgi:cytochrome bd-type quinol oxidase subunit 1